jgi:hypothetical protein
MAHDPDGFVARVELFNGDERLGQTSPNEWAGPNEPVHFHLRNLKPGHYVLTAKATDDSGASVTSEPVELTINRRPVTARIAAPNSGAQVQLPQKRVELYAEARNPDGRIARVEFYASGELIGTAGAKPFRVAWTDLKPGTYSLTAKVVCDDDTAVTSGPVTVTIRKAPNKPPVVSLREPANQQNFALPAEISLLADARDPDGQIARVEFFANGARIGEATTAPFRVTWKDPKPARYLLTAKAYDDENASKDSRPVIVTIKQSPKQPE